MSRSVKLAVGEPANPPQTDRDKLQESELFCSLLFCQMKLWLLFISLDSSTKRGSPDMLGIIQGEELCFTFTVYHLNSFNILTQLQLFNFFGQEASHDNKYLFAIYIYFLISCKLFEFKLKFLTWILYLNYKTIMCFLKIICWSLF